jgi:signal recognition particle subunit SRP54
MSVKPRKKSGARCSRADVNFRVVKDFVARIEARLVGEEVHKSFTPEQQIVRVVNDE